MSGVLDDLTEDEQAALVDLAKAKANGGLSRRDMMKLAGIGGVGALIGAGGTQAVGTAQADSGQSGTVGTQANPQDLYTQDIYAPLGDVLLNDSVDAQGNDLNSVGSIDTDEINNSPVVDPETTDWGTALEEAVARASEGQTIIVPASQWELQSTPYVDKRVNIQGVDHPTRNPRITIESDSLVIDSAPLTQLGISGLRVEEGSVTPTVEAAFRLRTQAVIGRCDIDGYTSGAGILFLQDGPDASGNRSRIFDVTVRDCAAGIETRNDTTDAPNLNAIKGVIDTNGCDASVLQRDGSRNWWFSRHHAGGNVVFDFREANEATTVGWSQYASDGVDRLVDVDTENNVVIHSSFGFNTAVNHTSGAFTRIGLGYNGSGLDIETFGGATGITTDSKDTVGGFADVTSSRSFATWYQNTTGTEMDVSVIGGVSATDGTLDCRLSINDSQNSFTIDQDRRDAASSSNDVVTVDGTVPAGYYYRVDAGGDTTLDSWFEQT